MKNAESEKLAIIEAHSEYMLVHDDVIPCASKQNIVLTVCGLEIIARNYFRKYGIIIRICPEFLKIDKLAEKMFVCLSAARNEFPDANKIGFIFVGEDDPNDVFGHALPIIWERASDGEHLFFLDTTQYLGATVFNKNAFENIEAFEAVQIFRKKLLSLMPTLRLWGMLGCRQIDYSSCYADALVVLRDGLRVTSLKQLAELKLKETSADITVFYAPEILLRTAQIGSFPEKSFADLTCLIRKNSQGLPETLDAFRRKFEVDVMVRGNPKKFGAFTLFKARQYAMDIERANLSKSLVSSVLDSFTQRRV